MFYFRETPKLSACLQLCGAGAPELLNQEGSGWQSPRWVSPTSLLPGRRAALVFWEQEEGGGGLQGEFSMQQLRPAKAPSSSSSSWEVRVEKRTL